MSKAFKIIVDIVIVLCILSVVALIVPSLVGVKTDIVGPKMDSNMQEGVVTYGVRRPVGALLPGDEIVYSGDDYLYVYTVEEVDTDNGEVHAVDVTTSQTSVLPLKKNAVKKVLAVPYLGYLMIATRTTTGMGMLISAALVLLALFIVAEVWYRKVRKEKAAVYKEEDDYFTALAQSMEKPSSLDELNRTPAPAAEPVQPADNEEAGKTMIVSEMPGAAAASEEIQELILEPVPEAPAAEGDAAELGATSVILDPDDADFVTGFENLEQDAKESEQQSKEAIEAYKRRLEATKQENGQPERYDTDNIVAAFAEIPDDNSAASLNMSDDQIPDVSDALVAALNTTQVSRPDRTYQPAQPVQEEEVGNEEADEIELAIPVKTVDEILEEAYSKGYDPLVTTDDVTGVKLVDFSDCL